MNRNNLDSMARYISSERIQGIPDSFYDLIDIFESELKESGLECARKVAGKLVVLQAWQCGGRGVYFPSLKRLAALTRQNDILNDYYRNNISVAEIVDKYHITQGAVYQILREKPLPDKR
ncbi:hypothetical protein E2D65_13545 [Salmonella enterica subsp. enterica serovar Newport]|uniref:Mor transcription activator domain-containing protein n=1 Tax=Salmonella newport TaxID=108619 RepID=A0A5Y2FFL7_SALNE|nr:hypothetical protein [Salmonella enterica subsp. enterica serovar Newport]